jgi:hypothetical protein
MRVQTWQLYSFIHAPEQETDSRQTPAPNTEAEHTRGSYPQRGACRAGLVNAISMHYYTEARKIR